MEFKAALHKKFIIFNYEVSRLDANIEFKMTASFGIVQQYGKDKDGFFVENYLYFSGLVAEYKGNIKAKFPILGEYETPEQKEPNKIPILDAKKVRIFKIYLLKT